MKHTAHRSFLATLSFLFVLAACSSTKITDSWQAPTLHRSQMDDVLVVAMTANATNRVLFERGFVDALKNNGLRATASFDVIGSSAPTRESVTEDGHQISEWTVSIAAIDDFLRKHPSRRLPPDTG